MVSACWILEFTRWKSKRLGELYGRALLNRVPAGSMVLRSDFWVIPVRWHFKCSKVTVWF
jgi:hypothetical protein